MSALRLVSALAAVSLGACAAALPPPVTPTTWETSTLEAEGLARAPYDQFFEMLPANDAEHGLHSMLVARHGRLVLERYWGGYDARTPHDLRSATKSITSLLVGAAVREGALTIEDPISTHLAARYPDAPRFDVGIRVVDLLTMRSGLDCNDLDPASPGNEERMYGQRDWVSFVLGLPSLEAPGLGAHYCTGGVVVLGSVVEEAVGEPFAAFADRVLFTPLGITARWSTFDEGTQVDTGGHLYLTPRDLLAVGQLLLNEGEWAGESVLDATWIADSFAQATTLDGQPYGRLFWLAHVALGAREVSIAYMSGNGGQLLFIVPELDLLAVFTGGNYNSPRAELPFQVFSNAVLASAL